MISLDAFVLCAMVGISFFEKTSRLVAFQICRGECY